MAPADYSWGVQLGAKHQGDSHTAPKALRQGSGGAAPSGGLGGGAPSQGGSRGRSPQRGARGQGPHVGGLGGRSPPENFAFLEANNLTRKCLN